MTVTYTGYVPNGSTFGCFWRVLLIWRGSVYKLVWRELVAYLILYYFIYVLHRFMLNEYQQGIFEAIRLYFSKQSETIPMSFVLGFYVTLVVKRWWEQYRLLPWPDTLALFLNAGIPGADERQRLMRRNIVRYAVLAYVITLQRVSLRVKKRFPTWQHVVDSGLMLESERKIFELMDSKTPMSKYWMPLVWATNIINRARKENLISSDHLVQTLLSELSEIRRRLGSLIGYDTVCVPLVYTQVVTLALYLYFIAALLGRQPVLMPMDDTKSDEQKFPDPAEYFPFFTAIQFCFYVGWLKVAEVLINPFGEDDDDIELNWLIDRHIKAAYMIVDEMHEEHPELLKDQYWEEVVPKELPYTVASEHYRKEEPKGSAEQYKVKVSESVYANLGTAKKLPAVEDVYADYESVDTPIVERRKSNWFSRQISRTGMGSIRSASTAYSSGGLFTRHRANSVYVNPENGQIGATGSNVPNGMSSHKMSLYDRLVGRKSGRNQKKPGPKWSGAAPLSVKHRPRIPTPEVAKEVAMERDNRIINTHTTILPATISNTHHQHGGGGSGGGGGHSMPPITLMSHTSSIPSAYPNSEAPVVQVVLSPIQELDGSGSVNNTLHAHQPGTAALAQAVLSSGLGPVITSANPAVSVPIPVSQLAALGLATSAHGSPLLSARNTPPPLPHPSSVSKAMLSSAGTLALPSTPIPNRNLRNEEVPARPEHGASAATDTRDSDGSDGSSSVSMDTRRTPNTNAGGGSAMLTPSDLSLLDATRKISVASQSSTKRGEVYV